MSKCPKLVCTMRFHWVWQNICTFNPQWSLDSVSSFLLPLALSMDFVSQKHGVPRDGPKDSNAGAERGRSWIATKHGDGSLESSNAQRTAERDTELYPSSGPSW
jgi:hypothetical protein